MVREVDYQENYQTYCQGESHCQEADRGLDHDFSTTSKPIEASITWKIYNMEMPKADSKVAHF
jgi:hypothetical protein